MQLNVEQRKIVNGKPIGHMLLKGVAGSGKTTVAVNRIPYLLSNYCISEDDKILMVTYNKTLINYIKYVYEKVEEENKIEVITLFSNKTGGLELKTIDSIIYAYFEEYKKQNNLNYTLLTDSNEKQSILSQSILELSKLFGDVKILDLKNISFLRDEIEWIKACNYLELEEYQSVDRLGRMGSKNSDGPQKLLKNSNTRRAIYELMLLYNKKLREKNYVDFQDMASLALKQASTRPLRKYTHIIIDESQDLTRIQLEFIKTLYKEKPYSSIMFVADTAQSIYPQAWLVKGRSFTTIGLDMKGKSNSLAKNYRTTTQIAEAAYSLIEKDLNIVEDDNFVKPSLIDKQGSYPVFKAFEASKSENEYVADLIKNQLIKKYDYKDIAIIARTKNQLTELKNALEKTGIQCRQFQGSEAMDFNEDAVKLLTMHSIKGLEFKVVMIIGLSNKIIPSPYSFTSVEEQEIQESRERKLLYVGMTRATEKLYLSGHGEVSKFIHDINSRYININDNSKVRGYYSINIDSYQFKNKIADLYSNEEKVRQWLIRELQETYKYPLELLDVEYKVNVFSKIGLVDGVVCIHNNKNKIPYIFIEVKRKNKGINDCLEQLKSYMSACSQCQYGIATDGNEFRVINRDFEEIEDIPMFNTSMLPSSIETFEYIDLKHKRKYDFLRDSNNIAEIIVDENGSEEEYKSNSLTRLNIYSDIAAGKPIFINSEIQDKFYIPYHWLKDSINSFILKIKGDSMIEADIFDGDYVIIKKQNTADNREIVAVEVDGNATLKRFIPMGDTIFLMSENKNYEPIQVKADQASIIGVAVGVIKSK